MTRLRPNEVFRKIQSKKQSSNSSLNLEIWARLGQAGKFPPEHQVDSPVDLGVDLVGPKSTALSTWLSTWSSRAVLPGAPFWVCVEFGGQIRF